MFRRNVSFFAALIFSFAAPATAQKPQSAEAGVDVVERLVRAKKAMEQRDELTGFAAVGRKNEGMKLAAWNFRNQYWNNWNNWRNAAPWNNWGNAWNNWGNAWNNLFWPRGQ